MLHPSQKELIELINEEGILIKNRYDVSLITAKVARALTQRKELKEDQIDINRLTLAVEAIVDKKVKFEKK